MLRARAASSQLCAPRRPRAAPAHARDVPRPQPASPLKTAATATLRRAVEAADLVSAERAVADGADVCDRGEVRRWA